MNFTLNRWKIYSNKHWQGFQASGIWYIFNQIYFNAENYFDYFFGKNDNYINIIIADLRYLKFNLKVKPHYYIEDIKEMINKKNKMSVDKQRLIFGGKSLMDGRMLSDYNITHDSTIHITLSMRGC